MSPDLTDLRVGSACTAAASSWVYRRGRPEATLAETLAGPLGIVFAQPVTPAGSKRFSYPGWEPHPRGIDLFVANEDGQPHIALELKVEAVDETLYDVYKLASLLRTPGVEAGFSVVVATHRTWERGGDCVDFFEGGIGQ